MNTFSQETREADYPITTQAELRRIFKAENPGLNFRRVVRMGGPKNDFVTDTRCAWVDFLSSMQEDGQISESLRERATL